MSHSPASRSPSLANPSSPSTSLQSSLQPAVALAPSLSDLQIAIVGDIHEQWEAQDEAALLALGVHLVLFVGDFGNEAVPLVQQVANLPIPAAVVLGNHDAWYSATDWGRKTCPYNRHQENRVQQQLDILGEMHVGYSARNFDPLQLSVVGGRPFSWGGPEWRHSAFYRERFNVNSMDASSTRIGKAVQQSQFETVIFLSHNGPVGLGHQPEDPCGKDWLPIGGDYGDLDLRAAIKLAKAMGKTVPLVTFGHMHHALRHTRSQLRRRIHVDADGTVYVNAACVPRLRTIDAQACRNFSLVSLSHDRVTQVTSVWVTAEGIITAQEMLWNSTMALQQVPCP